MNNTTNAAKRPSGLRACADGLDTNPDKYFAQKCMRHAADRMEELESSLAAVTEQLKAAQTNQKTMKQEQEYAKRTEIPNDMISAVNALREALHDNPCVILEGEDRYGKDRHYFFSDSDLFKALKVVVPFLPNPKDQERTASPASDCSKI